MKYIKPNIVRVGGRDESEDLIPGGKGLYLIQKGNNQTKTTP